MIDINDTANEQQLTNLIESYIDTIRASREKGKLTRLFLDKTRNNYFINFWG